MSMTECTNPFCECEVVAYDPPELCERCEVDGIGNQRWYEHYWELGTEKDRDEFLQQWHEEYNRLWDRVKRRWYYTCPECFGKLEVDSGLIYCVKKDCQWKDYEDLYRVEEGNEQN